MADQGYINTLTSVSVEETRSVLAHNAALSLVLTYSGGQVKSSESGADQYVEIYKKIYAGLS